MFDTRKLLDEMLGGLKGQAGGLQRPGESLGDTARRMLGDATGGGGSGGSLADTAKRVLGGSGGGGGQGVGFGGGALAGGALGLLLGSKKARKMAGKMGGTALTVGGLALVAGLAYKAWNTHQQQQVPGRTAAGGPDLLPPPSDSPFDPESTAGGGEARAHDFLVAMIAAAKADGHIDAEEQARIFGRLDELGLDTEAKAFVMDELRAPLDVERVVRLATDEASAMEIYAASLLAMDPDTPAERAYLDLLAARLRLDPGLAREIERSAAAALA